MLQLRAALVNCCLNWKSTLDGGLVTFHQLSGLKPIADLNYYRYWSYSGWWNQNANRKKIIWFNFSKLGASLVTRWQRICLSMLEIQVQSLIQEDPTCWAATKPVRHNYSRAQEPQLLSSCAATTEAHMTWNQCFTTREATTMRSPNTTTKSSLLLTATRESWCAAMKTQCSQK